MIHHPAGWAQIADAAGRRITALPKAEHVLPTSRD